MTAITLDSTEAITAAALALNIDDRTVLGHRLLMSVEEETAATEISPAMEAEIHRRMEEMKSGKVKGIPAEEIFARLREIAPGR